MAFSRSHDIILVYGKDINFLTINKEFSEEIPEHYNKIDENGKKYYLKPMRVMGGNVSESLYYPMIAPDGTKVFQASALQIYYFQTKNLFQFLKFYCSQLLHDAKLFLLEFRVSNQHKCENTKTSHFVH